VEDGVGPTADTEQRHRIVETMCSVPLSVAAAGIRGIVAWNGVGALALCTVPLFLLSSEPDASNDPALLRPFKPDLHAGMTVGAGHFHQLEVPEQVTPMVERFLELAITD
jgi:pimeloyl-ACP methyl ester carboxylesterase